MYSDSLLIQFRMQYSPKPSLGLLNFIAMMMFQVDKHYY